MGRSGSSSDPRAALHTSKKPPGEVPPAPGAEGSFKIPVVRHSNLHAECCFGRVWFFWDIFPADGKQCSTALAAGSFYPFYFFSPVQELKKPLADTKAELDATAFDIQLLISEHAQDLTPQQSRQLLRLLNELQKAFRDLSERVTARVEVLQVCLQQVEQTDQVKVVRHLLPGCPLLAEALPSHRNRS